MGGAATSIVRRQLPDIKLEDKEVLPPSYDKKFYPTMADACARCEEMPERNLYVTCCAGLCYDGFPATSISANNCGGLPCYCNEVTSGIPCYCWVAPPLSANASAEAGE